MCAFKLTNPGLPAELWDAFGSDDDSDEPVEDEHQLFLSAQAMCMPAMASIDVSRAI